MADEVLRAAVKRYLAARCYDHEAACCEEWCSMCQSEVEAEKALRLLLDEPRPASPSSDTEAGT
jgi:hypothetical protein